MQKNQRGSKRLLSLVLAVILVMALVPAAAMSVWAASTYTVAGVSGLCGSNWDTADTDNDMTLIDGVYTKVYTGVPANTAGYEFKIAADHSWDTNYGPSSLTTMTSGTEYSTVNNGQNFKIPVAADGSTVTITFNATSQKVVATVEAPAGPVTYPETIYFLNSDGWAQPYAHMWTGNSGGTSWPGARMTHVGGQVWFVSRVGNGQYIIFNIGSNAAQTTDLAIPTDGKNMYNWATQTWGTYQPVTINVDGTEQVVNAGDNVLATLGGDETTWHVVGADGSRTNVGAGDVFPAAYTVYSSLSVGLLGTMQDSRTDIYCASVGGQLIAAPSVSTVSYQWYVDDAAVPDATSSTYTIQAADAGKEIYVEVSTSYDKAVSMKVNAISSIAAKLPDAVKAGQTVTAEIECLDRDMTLQWMLDGEPVPGETATDYTTTPADEGKVLTLVISFMGKEYPSNPCAIDSVPPVISGVEEGVTYYTTQVATVTDDNLDTVTVNGVEKTAPLTLAGNVDATYEIVATDKAGNEAKLTVTMKPIAPLADPIKDLTVDNVTLDDEDDIRAVIGTVEDVDTTNATDEEKAALDAILDKCEELFDRLEEMLNAVNTDAVMDTLDVTKDNVTPEDKEKLEQAKEDLENALEDYAGNLTEENVEVIENLIQQIEDALDALENAEAVKDAIDELPETAEPDNEDVIKALEDAKAAYDALTDHEKELVGDVSKLDKLAQSLVAYKLIKGDGSTWTKESGKELSFTANGAYSKFASLEIDGKTVDAANYTAASGSTVITLKASYLETLSVGKHTISVKYPDGAANGTFTVEKAPTNGSATTGDAVNLTLLAVLLIASAAGIVTTVSVKGKKQW